MPKLIDVIVTITSRIDASAETSGIVSPWCMTAAIAHQFLADRAAGMKRLEPCARNAARAHHRHRQRIAKRHHHRRGRGRREVCRASLFHAAAAATSCSAWRMTSESARLATPMIGRPSPLA
jgi:hypothetical protein